MLTSVDEVSGLTPLQEAARVGNLKLVKHLTEGSMRIYLCVFYVCVFYAYLCVYMYAYFMRIYLCVPLSEGSMRT